MTEEFAPYFALDYTLTARYAEEKNRNSERLDTVLPWFTVIGEDVQCSYFPALGNLTGIRRY